MRASAPLASGDTVSYAGGTYTVQYVNSKGNLDLQAAAASGIDGTSAVNMGVRIRLVGADNYDSRPTAEQRLHVSVHATTTVTVDAKLFAAAPLT